jgi:cyclohexyl-isocyanide hydratase
MLTVGMILYPVRSEKGLTIAATRSFDAAPKINILFVPGGPGVNKILEDDDRRQRSGVQKERLAQAQRISTKILV